MKKGEIQRVAPSVWKWNPELHSYKDPPDPSILQAVRELLVRTAKTAAPDLFFPPFMAWLFRFLDFVTLRLHDVLLEANTGPFLILRRSFLTSNFCQSGVINEAGSPFLVLCWWCLPVMSVTTPAKTFGWSQSERKQISLDIPSTLVLSEFCVPSTGLYHNNFSICFSFCLPCGKTISIRPLGITDKTGLLSVWNGWFEVSPFRRLSNMFARENVQIYFACKSWPAKCTSCRKGPSCRATF